MDRARWKTAAHISRGRTIAGNHDGPPLSGHSRAIRGLLEGEHQNHISSDRHGLDVSHIKYWEMPVNQRNGPHLELPDLVTLTPFNTIKDYENYISRLRQIPRVFDQVIGNMRQGMRDGLMPPRYLLEKVAPEAEDVASQTGESSPFAKPLKEFPSTIPAANQEGLRAELLAAIGEQIIPVYKRFAAFVRDEYAPHGRTEPGVWALPDGDASYRYAIRRMTTTDLTPDQIHEIGLQELKENEAEML